LTRSPLPTTKVGFCLALGPQIAEQVVRRAGLARLLALLPRRRVDRVLREEQLLALNVQEIYAWLGRPDMLLLATLSGLNLEEALDLREHTNFRAALAFLLSFTPLRGLSRRYLDEAAATVLPGTHAEVVYLRAKAAVRINQGCWSEAVESAEQAVARARAHKDDLSVMHCLVQRDIAAIGLDDFDRAEQIACEMERLAIRAENPRYLAIALIIQGATRLRFGEPVQAEEVLSRAHAILAPELGLMPLAMLTGLLAMSALMQGRFDRAEALASEGMAVVRRARWPLVELRLPLNCIVDVYLSLDDPERHAPEIRAGLATLHRIAWESPSARPILLVLEGRWFFHRGRPARAVASVRRALSAARRQGMRYDQAVTLFALGCLARSEGGRRNVPEGAEVHLRDALALFERLGARFEADKTRAALWGRRLAPIGSPRSAWR
jgi:hypothetical protein